MVFTSRHHLKVSFAASCMPCLCKWIPHEADLQATNLPLGNQPCMVCVLPMQAGTFRRASHCDQWLPLSLPPLRFKGPSSDQQATCFCQTAWGTFKSCRRGGRREAVSCHCRGHGFPHWLVGQQWKGEPEKSGNPLSSLRAWHPNLKQITILICTQALFLNRTCPQKRDKQIWM